MNVANTTTAYYHLTTQTYKEYGKLHKLSRIILRKKYECYQNYRILLPYQLPHKTIRIKSSNMCATWLPKRSQLAFSLTESRHRTLGMSLLFLNFWILGYFAQVRKKGAWLSLYEDPGGRYDCCAETTGKEQVSWKREQSCFVLNCNCKWGVLLDRNSGLLIGNPLRLGVWDRE